MNSFFKTANPEQLRELTLREPAAQIDARQRYTLEKELQTAPDQVMVCLSSRGPNSALCFAACGQSESELAYAAPDFIRSQDMMSAKTSEEVFSLLRHNF